MQIGDEKQNTKNYIVQFNRTRILYTYTILIHGYGIFRVCQLFIVHAGSLLYRRRKAPKVFFAVTRGFRAMLVFLRSALPRNNILPRLRGGPL